MGEIIEKELSYSIVKAAYEVFNELGPGFAEEIYEEAMIVVLKNMATYLNSKSGWTCIFKARTWAFINLIWLLTGV